MHEQRGQGVPSWTRRARSAGGRVLGHAGSALGEQHLSTEALVAFVDGELALGAHQRAAAHVAACGECSGEVRAQVQARSAVRGAAVPSLPLGLLGALRGIPGASPEPPPTAPPSRGVVLDEHGAWVAVLRPDRFGPQQPPADPPEQGPGGPRPARGRGALGLVVVGVGVLAVGLLAPSSSQVPPAGAGAAPVQQARLQVVVATTGATTAVTAAPTPQTATSPAGGRAVPHGAAASVVRP